MTTNLETPLYTLDEGEKVATVMIYTANMLIWGDVITKEAVRVSTWLRTPAIPKYIVVYTANVMTFGSGTPSRPQIFRSLHLPSAQVLGFHMKPPARDPLDYDPNEPMRKMEPLTALVGTFRYDGLLRMSTHTSLDKYLEVAKETFAPIYEVEITQPSLPSLGVIRVPYVLVRSEMVLFSPREV